MVESDPVLREAETESDCLADRAAALDEQKVWTNNGPRCICRFCSTSKRKWIRFHLMTYLSLSLSLCPKFIPQNGEEAWYVPECTPDGRYQRIQCYRKVGYCWCVHEDTGKNIPGTSIKDGRPDCAIINLTRPMKGCPEPRKLEFLKELKDFLRTQIATTTG